MQSGDLKSLIHCLYKEILINALFNADSFFYNNKQTPVLEVFSYPECCTQS